MNSLIPRKTLFGNPEKVSPGLSPDGRRLAYLAPDEGVMNVWVRTVGRDDDRPVTRDRGRGIQGWFWAENNEQIIYVQDRDGDENWHVYAIPASGGEGRDLTPIEGIQARIVAVDPDHPDEILVGLNDRDPQLHDVYRLHLPTGERTLAARNDMGAIGWTADHDLVVRVAQVATPEGGFQLLHRSTADEDWKPVYACGVEDSFLTWAAAFAGDNETLYLVSSVGTNTSELRALHCVTGEERMLASDPEVDISDFDTHPTTHDVRAVSFEKERLVHEVLDDGIRADWEALEGLHHGDFSLVSSDRADRTWLVAYNQDLGSVAYYAWDRDAKRGTHLFSARPELDKEPLAEMKPVSYKARDGLTIHAYLTLPPGVEAKGLPAVVNVHGGPWVRDSWGYHPEAQWLANRGYACLQVNYRGSTGYGKEFINAADREWGGRMQEDVEDGVQWLLDQGIADPGRVGIYGGSYGGFATLSGMTKTPELFACGVDVVGPSNLITWMNTVPPYWEPFKPIIVRRVGDPVADEEFLKSRSPLFHIDRIAAPLFIVQGANDPRVPRAESIQIRDALQEGGKTVEYLEFADEGHGFVRPENRLTFYAAAEKFLATHLGGRYQE